MKKTILLLTYTMLCVMLSAQTQQGYVKTKGRMVNGQLVSGQGLKGATVSIQNRTPVVVQNTDGSFSFPIPAQTFILQSVQKNGYQLVDADVIRKPYNYSANPIYLVMETPEQQLQDQLATERKIRRTLTNQLHQKEDEIEALKDQQKISDEEYRQALQKLYEETDQNEQLVKDMVERYATIDYDRLSEFDQRISELILNGELTKADSMLRTKGDINERVSQYRKHEAINVKEKEELALRQEQLEQSELLAKKELEDLANDCYRKFEIFKMRHLNDSAAYYLELRVTLDTTNMNWMEETGMFLREFLAQYDKALSYYEKALRANNYANDEKSAPFFEHMGVVYNDLGFLDKAMEYYNKALSIWELDSENNIYDIIITYTNISNICKKTLHFDQALLFLQKALELHQSCSDQDSTDRAFIYINFTSLYNDLEDYDNALKYGNKALRLMLMKHDENHPDLARYYNDIGNTYYYKGEYNKAIENFQKYLSIVLTQFGKEHPDVALAYNNIATVMGTQNQFEQSISYSLQSIEIDKKIFGENNFRLTNSYRNIATKYIRLADYENATSYTNMAINLAKLYERKDLEASCYNSLGVIQCRLGNYEASIAHYEQALAIDTLVFGKQSLEVATVYSNLSSVYYYAGKYQNGLELAKKSLEIREMILGESHTDVAQSYNNVGSGYYYLKDYQNSVHCFIKALTIWKSLFGTNHLDVAIATHNIAKLHDLLEDYQNSKNEFEEAANSFKSVLGEEHSYVGLCYDKYGDMLSHSGNYEEATKKYQMSLDVLIPLQGETSEKVMEIKEKISEAQSKLKEQENQPNE